jgi:post-segregation antitoxin (ccd killing protein)
MMKKTEKLTVTVPVELHAQVRALAVKDGRNLSNMVTVLIQKGIGKEKAAYSR